MPEQTPRDILTGFFQREALEPYLRQLIINTKSGGAVFSLAVIDVDHFKRFNDRHGHLFGDEILKYATSTLRLTFFEGQCIFFRYGGDEFIAVFPGKSAKEALSLLRQCHYNLRHRPCLYENHFYHVSVSCGVAAFPDDAQDVQELIQRADEAMYFSKKTGRKQTTLYGRIGFLKLKRLFLFWTALTCVTAALVVIYRLTYHSIIQPKWGQIRSLKIVSKPADLDTIVLRSGLTFEGRILAQNRGSVILQLYFDDGGEGQMTFKRSEISRITYGVTE